MLLDASTQEVNFCASTKVLLFRSCSRFFAFFETKDAVLFLINQIIGSQPDPFYPFKERTDTALSSHSLTFYLLWFLSYLTPVVPQ